MFAMPEDTTGVFATSFLELFAGEKLTPLPGVTNLFGHAVHGDTQVVAGAGQLFGTFDPIFIEDQPLGETHSITLIADSLAVMDLLARFDPSLTTATLNNLFEAASSQRTKGGDLAEGDSLERILDTVGAIFFPTDWQPSPVDRSNQGFADIGNRDLFHDNIHRLRDIAEGDHGVAKIEGSHAVNFAEKAETDVAYRYALKHLNVFVVVGRSDLYAAHNQDGELEKDDPETRKGMSDDYLRERAGFLSSLAYWNSVNGVPLAWATTATWRFEDRGLGVTIENADPANEGKIGVRPRTARVHQMRHDRR